MVMRTTFVAAVLAAGLIPAAVQAADLHFAYTAPDGVSASWDQSSTPNVSFSAADTSTIVDVTNGAASQPSGPAPQYYTVAFFSANAVGRFQGGFLLVGTDTSFVKTNGGDQVYTGPETAPTFAPGVFAMNNGSLTVSPVPEPATWAMLLVGLAGLGAGLRGARRRSAPATV